MPQLPTNRKLVTLRSGIASATLFEPFTVLSLNAVGHRRLTIAFI